MVGVDSVAWFGFLGCLVNFVGVKIKGVFREGVSASDVDYYKDKYDLGEVVVFEEGNEKAAKIAGSLLKMFLREMPEPLLTFRYGRRMQIVYDALPGFFLCLSKS